MVQIKGEDYNGCKTITNLTLPSTLKERSVFHELHLDSAPPKGDRSRGSALSTSRRHNRPFRFKCINP